MKILLITLEYPPFKGGVAHYYGHLIKALSDKLSIDVMTNESGRLIDQRWPVLRWLPSLYWISQEIKVKKINYILVGQILPIGTAVWLLSYLFNFKYSVILHGLDLSMAKATHFKKLLTLKILTRADKIICANSRVADDVKKLLTASQWGKIAVVNPGIDIRPLSYDETSVNQLKSQYKLQNKKVFLTIGRLVKRKGVDTVLRALALALEQDKNLVYVIIGQGEELEQIQTQIRELKLQDSVILLTDIDDQQKVYWLQLCDVFIMVTREITGDYEGFGIVYLEAGLAGKPVIAGRAGGVSDAVINDVTGIIVASEDVQAVTKAMLDLAEFSGLRQRLGDAGRRRAINNFNWEGQSRKIFDLISIRQPTD